jgi:hypothetical protein
MYDISLFIPEGICFAAFVAFVAQTTWKGKKANTHTRIRKLTKT